VPTFIERFVLPGLVGLFVTVVVNNVLNLRFGQRIAVFGVTVCVAYLLATAIHPPPESLSVSTVVPGATEAKPESTTPPPSAQAAEPPAQAGSAHTPDTETPDASARVTEPPKSVAPAQAHHGSGPPAQVAVYALSSKQKRFLVPELAQLRSGLPRILITRAAESAANSYATVLAEVFARAGIEVVTDLQSPTGPEQTGLIICVENPANPPDSAVQLQRVLQQANIGASFGHIAERSRAITPGFHIVVFVAPEPIGRPTQGPPTMMGTRTPPAIATPPAPTFVNTGAFGANSPAVLFCDRDTKKVATRLTDDVVAQVKGFSALFTDAFIESGKFERAARGDMSAFRDAGVTESAASAIIVGTRSIAVTPQEPVPGTHTFKAVALASFRIYRPKDAFKSTAFNEEAVGAAFTADDAERDADRKLAALVATRLTEIK
jgi:hypothetical protein